MTFFTGIEVAERVEEWQHRLAPLGVDHFRIDRVIIGDAEDEDGGNRDQLASASVSDKYADVRFFFSADYLSDCDPRDLDETIVHEWLHVAGRDLDIAILDLEDQMAPTVWDMVKVRIHKEREGEVEGLARLIVSLWYAPKVASLEKLDLLYRTNRQ